MRKATGSRLKVGVVDHHFGDYSAGLSVALQDQADVALALSSEGLRELTVAQRASLESLAHFTTYDPRTKAGELKSLITLLRFFRAAKPDFLIIHENGQYYSPVFIAIMRRLCPVYLIVHDPAPHTGADATAAKKRAGRIALERRLASICVVHGQYCVDLLRSQLRHKEIVSIPHGPVLRDKSIAKQVEAEGANEILMFGRMQHYKGVDLLISAFERVAQDYPGVRLRLAGRGPELLRHAEAIKQLNERIVVHDEFVPPEDLIRYIAAAAVVVLPYRNATQSGVVAAAFANERAVIVTRVGAIAEVVQDEVNGLMIEPGSITTLEIALRRFLSDADLRERLRKGVIDTAPSFAWSVAATTLLAHAQLSRAKES